MHTQLAIIKAGRVAIVEMIDSVTLEQANTVPAGHNNNLVWQLGHVIAAQQGLAYLLSGLAAQAPMELVARYGSNTKPERDVTAEELQQLKDLSTETLAQFERDLADGLFKTYEPLTIRDTTVANIDDAVEFLVFHEGAHLGAAGALKRAVTV